MGETKEAQRKAKAILDEKLQLSVPECELLENLAVKCRFLKDDLNFV